MQQIDVLLDYDILVNNKGKNAIINFIINVINNTEQEIESFHAKKSKKKLEIREELFNSINRDVGIFFRDYEKMINNQKDSNIIQ